MFVMSQASYDNMRADLDPVDHRYIIVGGNHQNISIYDTHKVETDYIEGQGFKMIGSTENQTWPNSSNTWVCIVEGGGATVAHHSIWWTGAKKNFAKQSTYWKSYSIRGPIGKLYALFIPM